MASVEIYKEISGFPIEWWMARLPEAQAGLDEVTAVILAGAEANLARVRANPRYTGSFKSYVDSEKGTLGVDRFVHYSDDLDKRAAWEIEFGKPGHFILTSAAMVAAEVLEVNFEYYGA